MRAKDLVKDNIAYHHTLNQDVWAGDELRVDVRYKLLEIAKRFVEYLDVPDFKLIDVILRGSLTNYNYTRYSDFDLHIVTDYATINCDITEPFYMAKKKIWNDEHDIYIKGHEVELYVEDRDEENASEGMYSVLDNKWHKRPEYRRPDINDHAVASKAKDLMTQINRAIKEGNVEDITRLQAKIKDMRQAGLDRAGEFSTENLAFKIIRNKGYIDRLYKTKQQKVDQELSLDENFPKVDGGYEHNGLGYKKDYATGKYPVHPLPRWNIFDKHHRNPEGTWADIYHYMRFLQDSYQTSSMDISGNEIADTIAKMYNKNSQQELKELNSSKGYKFKSWDEFYQALKEHHKQEMIDALTRTRSLDETEETYSVKTDKGEEFACNDLDHAKNKARSLLSYKKADKVYILKNGQAVYSWQLNSKLEPIDERKKSKKKRSKRGYPISGYYGYYWGGNNDNSDSAGDAGGGGDGGGESMYESQAQLDPGVEEFLDGLTPDDVGYDEVGDYVVHYEGFTDQCQDSEEYQDDPESVFDQVWSDFRKRMGGKDPVNYGIVGSHDYPIVYSVFRR